MHQLLVTGERERGESSSDIHYERCDELRSKYPDIEAEQVSGSLGVGEVLCCDQINVVSQMRNAPETISQGNVEGKAIRKVHPASFSHLIMTPRFPNAPQNGGYHSHTRDHGGYENTHGDDVDDIKGHIIFTQDARSSHLYF